MPIASLSATKAMSSLRENAFAFWPDGRRDGERLEGLVLPASTPSFQLRPGSSVFTIGSCFARNIEAQLQESGFRVPARTVSLPEEERASAVANDILNKYNPHSIVNELRWAFETPFPQEAYIDLGDGLWHDPHLAGGIKPARLKRLIRRRAMVTRLFQTLPRCRSAVVTLGLVEAWHDLKTGLYMNGAPPKPAVEREPDRFRLDVLSFNEILSELEEMWALIQKYGHPKVRVLITVSPVPLKATYSGQDVLVANSYSKSVLRAAVGQFAAAHDGVDYFPSFEAAMLTARPIAFGEDNRHVTNDLVKAIMERVTDTYVQGGNPPEAVDDEEESVPEKRRRYARQVRNLMKKGAFRTARRLLRDVREKGDYEAAGFSEFQFYYCCAVTLAETGDLLEAEMAVAEAIKREPNSAMAYNARGRILSRQGKPMGAEKAFRKVVELDPTNIDARRRMARMEARNGKLPEAEESVLAALAIDPTHAETIALLAEIRAMAGQAWTPDDSDRLVPTRETVPEPSGLRNFLRGLSRA